MKLPLVNGPLVPRIDGYVQGEVRVSGFSSLLAFGVPKLSGEPSQQQMPFSHRGLAVTTRDRIW